MDHSLNNNKWFNRLVCCFFFYVDALLWYSRYKNQIQNLKSQQRISIKIEIKWAIFKIDASMKRWLFQLSNDGHNIKIGYLNQILVLNWMHILILNKNMETNNSIWWLMHLLCLGWKILSLHNTYNNNSI